MRLFCDPEAESGVGKQMFAIWGGGLAKLKHMENGGKRTRRNIDQWDRVCL